MDPTNHADKPVRPVRRSDYRVLIDTHTAVGNTPPDYCGMHYCFLLTFDFKSAASFRMQQLGAALIARGLRVSYILNDSGKGDSGVGLPAGASLELIPPGSQIKMVLARRRAIRRLKPDLVEVLNPHPQTLLALMGMRNLRVVGLWDEPLMMHKLGLKRHLLDHAWNRWLLARAWLKVTASRYLQELLRDRYHAPSTYLPHVTYVKPLTDGISPFSEPTVVYVGNLYSVWDHDLVFAAALELARRGRSPAISIVGRGPELEKWRAFAKQHNLDRVNLVGFLSEEDMWRHLRHAQALLFPMRPTVLNRSRCSSKLLAYAQSKRPIIANRVGEAPQILSDLPIWVEPTPEGFADAIDRITTQPRQPDVNYDLERLSPSTRASELLEAIRQREAKDIE
jgi:glycosyltransferase involved in cell wall biosynthesis